MKESELIATNYSNDGLRSERDAAKENVASSITTLRQEIEVMSKAHDAALKQKEAATAKSLSKLAEELIAVQSEIRVLVDVIGQVHPRKLRPYAEDANNNSLGEARIPDHDEDLKRSAVGNKERVMQYDERSESNDDPPNDDHDDDTDEADGHVVANAIKYKGQPNDPERYGRAPCPECLKNYLDPHVTDFVDPLLIRNVFLQLAWSPPRNVELSELVEDDDPFPVVASYDERWRSARHQVWAMREHYKGSHTDLKPHEWPVALQFTHQKRNFKRKENGQVDEAAYKRASRKDRKDRAKKNKKTKRATKRKRVKR
jgi:hypothetical protein